MKPRMLVIHGTITVDGEQEPEYIVTYRIPWPEDQTLEEIADATLAKMCRDLHRPKLTWSTS